MSRTTAGIIGAAIVPAVIVLQHLFMGRAVIVLSVGFSIAYVVWLATYDTHPRLRHGRILLLYGIAILVQTAHMFEEFRTGFQREFVGFFGYEWSDTRFLAFNLIALGVFILAFFGVWAGVRLSYLIVWLMVIVGGVGNGIFHIGVSLSRGAYFPGSGTAVLHLIVGVMLLRELLFERDATIGPNP